MKKNTPAERLRSLFQIARQRRTGVLTIRGGNAPRSFFIEEGAVRIVSGADPSVYFAQWLKDGETIKPRRLNRAVKAQDGQGGFLLSHVSELGYANDDDLIEMLDYAVRKELTRLVDSPDGSVRFSEGALDYEAFGDGVEDFLLDRSLEAWVLDAASVREAVDIFRSIFPTEKDVFAPWGEVVSADDSQGRVLELVDGLRTIDQIVAEAPFSHFEVLRALYELECDERIHRRSAEELIGVAREFQREGRIDHSQRMYELAKFHGADEMEIAWNLGRNFELMGDDESAVNQYVEFGQLAEAAGRREDALRGFRKAVELQRENVELREAVLRVLDESQDADAAAREVCELVPLLMVQDLPERARELILRQIEGGDVGRSVCERLSSCLDVLGRHEREPFLEIAERFADQDGRGQDALVLLEHLARESTDAEIDIRRAVLLEREGRRADAIALLEPMAKALTETKADSAPDRVEWVRQGLEILVAADVADEAGRAWLADLYDGREQRDTAAHHLEDLARIQSGSGDKDALADTLRRLIELEPDRVEHRRDLGFAYLDTGRERAGSEMIREVAIELATADQAEEAIALLDRVISACPADLDARRVRLECMADNDETRAERRERMQEAARLAMVLRQFEAAAELFEAADGIEHSPATELRALADCYTRLERVEDEGRTWVRVARIEHAAENYGSMREACERALGLGVEDEELMAWIAPSEEVSEPIEEEVMSVATNGNHAPRESGRESGRRSVFGDQVLELMRKPAAESRVVARDEVANEPADTRRGNRVESEREVPKAPANRTVSDNGAGVAGAVKAAKAARASKSHAPASDAPSASEAESLPDAAQFARTNKEEKPSISGIVARLKSFKG